jgi:opacity protein-like surface antigen
MRRLLAAIGLIASMCGARAQEFELPTLRTPGFVPPPAACCVTWGGLYVGGQLGYGFSSVDFAPSTQPLIAHMLRDTQLEAEDQVSTFTVLGKTDTRAASYGAFAGYNSQWESLILGIELNYSHTNLDSSAASFPLSRILSAGGNQYNLTLTGTGRMDITDLATLRARAGWEAGSFLPYLFLGVAAGRADVALSAKAFGFETVFSTSPYSFVPFSFSEIQSKTGAFLFGWAIGGGVDVMVLPSVFLRAEYEYVAFSELWQMKATINTGRLALGLKF